MTYNFANRKSHMSFRLIPESVTLNDLERHNSPNLCVISRNSVVFGTDYVKVVKVKYSDFGPFQCYTSETVQDSK